MRILLSVGTCVLLGIGTVVAQQQQQQPQPQQPRPTQDQKPDEPIQGPTFRTGIDLVAVDVAVVDRRGRPIEDLHAAEFSVKIDGEVRRVVSAELVKVDVEAAKKQVADKSESFYTSNLTPPQGRQIVIAVDQVNIRPGSLRPVLDAAGRFLDMLSPLDQVAFVAYPEPGPRVNFTNDKLRLKRAMQGLVGQQPRARPGTYNIGVSEAINIEFEREISAKEAQRILREAPGIMLVDKHEDGGYVTPIECVGEYATYVSRVREDPTVDSGLSLWCVSDNLRKGAALNAVQIAELLGRRHLKKAA